MIGIKSKVGDSAKFMYPTHGRLNTLRHVAGKIVNIGSGPKGQFVTVEEGTDKIRSFSTSKIVMM